jgi:hypothetical protein
LEFELFNSEDVMQPKGRRRGRGALWFACVALGGLLAVSASAQGPACVGDCNGDGTVLVNELVTGLNNALLRSGVAFCTAFDENMNGFVDIAELVLGVGNSLNDCPVIPTAGIVFNGENNRLHAYDPSDGFRSQTVIENAASDPQGRDINGQICFIRSDDGALHFIAGEDTEQPVRPAGWGYFRLEGSSVGSFKATQLGKLAPTYQPGDDPENYGCGFLSDGRLLTTDVGNQAAGPLNGQLVVWFPPFDVEPGRYCKVDITIGTAQQIAFDDQDRVYVASARGPAVYLYTGEFPTSDDAAGGCGRTDGTGAPLVDEGRVSREVFIPQDQNIATPAGIVLKPDGGFYVSSVLTGVIAEYDENGVFVQRVLQPVEGRTLPPFPETGTPLGLGLASDGTLYFADIGLVFFPSPGPGDNLGTVRRIRFVDGKAQPPETMDEGLNFPDGIGILE